MKKTRKILIWSISGLLIIYILVNIFPQSIFNNKLEYKCFTVYYHSGETNKQKLKLVLDKSAELVKTSELFEKGFKQKLFLCSGYTEFTFFVPLARKAFGVNRKLNQNVFLSKSDVSENITIRNGKENNKRTMSSVIAHETTHSLLQNKLGFIKNELLPTWKKEGYCEFIARESSYDKQKGLQDICNGNENLDSPSFKYFKYRLYVKYLFEDINLSFNEFLNGDFEIAKLNKSLKKKYCTQYKKNSENH